MKVNVMNDPYFSSPLTNVKNDPYFSPPLTSSHNLNQWEYTIAPPYFAMRSVLSNLKTLLTVISSKLKKEEPTESIKEVLLLLETCDHLMKGMEVPTTPCEKKEEFTKQLEKPICF